VKKIFFIFILHIIFFSFLGKQKVYAANTTIGFFPSMGSFNNEFTVNLIVDGHGDKFNAAQATVSISSGLAVKDIVLGNCNFSFLKTPSRKSPSFAGVILSTNSTKCAVYSLTLVPIAKGNGVLSLSDGSVKRYGDAANVLSSTQNGSYTLTAALKAPSVPGDETKQKSQTGLYTVNLTILSAKNTPMSNTIVILTPVSGKTRQEATTKEAGTVHFTNLQPGIYNATIEKDSTKVGEHIINVSGANHVLTFGINIKGEQGNPLMKKAKPLLQALTSSPLLMGVFLLVGIMIGTGIAIVFVRVKGRKKIPA
jgi:hypothetical protein